MSFATKKLPAGLTLDSQSGVISDSLNKPGEFTFIAHAKNSIG
jgi:hypothetical protein